MPPTSGDPFQRATVEIVADASQLKEQLQQAKAEVEKATAEMSKMGDTADQATAKAASGFQDMAIKLAATVTVILAAVDGFVKLYDKADDYFNGSKDFNLGDPGKTASERVSALRKEIEQLKKEVADRSLFSRVTDASEFYFGTESSRTQALKKIADAEKQIQQQTIVQNRQADEKEAATKAARLQREISREEEATLQGVDRIIAQRDRRIAEAQKQYGKDADPLVRAIASRAESEINQFRTTEAAKKEIEDRNRQEREKRQKESDERIAKNAADAAAREMSRMYGQITEQFSSLFNAQWQQIAFTIEGLSANVEKMANQRKASGL